MQFQGTLVKMPTWLGQPIQYYLPLGDDLLQMNQLIGKTLTFQHTGYTCLNCHSSQKRIFRQGFCYDCFSNSAKAGDWIMHPEKSQAHLGIEDRDLAYEQAMQLQPHIVYFAVASDLKVGVTRKSQVPTRWIDQGASWAMPIVEVPNRYLAGITEVALKSHFTDKTNWRKMLQNHLGTFDLVAEREKVATFLPEEIRPYFETTQAELLELQFPVQAYPQKISSNKLEEGTAFTGVLSGIKGQYLLFEDGGVFNVRSFEGFNVLLTVS